MFDVDKALEFYRDYLDFSIDWEHRFEEGLPLYMQVRRGACLLHLSEHYGDSTPGSCLRIRVPRIDEFHARLTAKNFRFARPGIEDQTWGTREVILTDPFGNRVIFYEELTKGPAEG
jgi:uncharacterized glyoxalase superfamily protein PhnB